MTQTKALTSKDFFQQDNVKAIPLTKGFFATVDECDYEFLSQYKWCVQVTGKSKYAVTHIKIDGKYVRFSMHRLICGVTQKDIQIDHKDGDGLNNRQSNLRACTYSQNMFNTKSKPGSSSKYKGVTWHKTHSRWMAAIKVNGVNKYLGYFNTEEDAAKAYNVAAKTFHREFARLNEV